MIPTDRLVSSHNAKTGCPTSVTCEVRSFSSGEDESDMTWFYGAPLPSLSHNLRRDYFTGRETQSPRAMYYINVPFFLNPSRFLGNPIIITIILHTSQDFTLEEHLDISYCQTTPCPSIILDTIVSHHRLTLSLRPKFTCIFMNFFSLLEFLLNSNVVC